MLLRSGATFKYLRYRPHVHNVAGFRYKRNIKVINDFDVGVENYVAQIRGNIFLASVPMYTMLLIFKKNELISYQLYILMSWLLSWNES